ncbi:sugar 3,4-ketoisomerase [Piscinibacter sakaiensis]|uniref:sugar 3,4-ketoisomerase n=1 Tax=Piscinibacter sakaiensis TaxID=1547922 RepID=UPI003AAAABB2
MKLNVCWHKLNTICDARGCLTAIEAVQNVSFEIKRIFYMHDVRKGADRGGHAHKDTDQFAIAISGSLRILVSNGVCSKVVILNEPGWGVYLPRLTWTRLYDFSDDAVCLVLANTHYDRSKSIRTWSEFQEFAGAAPSEEPTDAGLFLRPKE